MVKFTYTVPTTTARERLQNKAIFVNPNKYLRDLRATPYEKELWLAVKRQKDLVDIFHSPGRSTASRAALKSRWPKQLKYLDPNDDIEIVLDSMPFQADSNTLVDSKEEPIKVQAVTNSLEEFNQLVVPISIINSVPISDNDSNTQVYAIEQVLEEATTISKLDKDANLVLEVEMLSCSDNSEINLSDARVDSAIEVRDTRKSEHQNKASSNVQFNISKTHETALPLAADASELTQLPATKVDRCIDEQKEGKWTVVGKKYKNFKSYPINNQNAQLNLITSALVSKEKIAKKVVAKAQALLIKAPNVVKALDMGSKYSSAVKMGLNATTHKNVKLLASNTPALSLQVATRAAVSEVPLPSSTKVDQCVDDEQQEEKWTVVGKKYKNSKSHQINNRNAPLNPIASVLVIKEKIVKKVDSKAQALLTKAPNVVKALDMVSKYSSAVKMGLNATTHKKVKLLAANTPALSLQVATRAAVSEVPLPSSTKVDQCVDDEQQEEKWTVVGKKYKNSKSHQINNRNAPLNPIASVLVIKEKIVKKVDSKAQALLTKAPNVVKALDMVSKYSSAVKMGLNAALKVSVKVSGLVPPVKSTKVENRIKVPTSLSKIIHSKKLVKEKPTGEEWIIVAGKKKKATK